MSLWGHLSDTYNNHLNLSMAEAKPNQKAFSGRHDALEAVQSPLQLVLHCPSILHQFPLPLSPFAIYTRKTWENRPKDEKYRSFASTSWTSTCQWCVCVCVRLTIKLHLAHHGFLVLLLLCDFDWRLLGDG